MFIGEDQIKMAYALNCMCNFKAKRHQRNFTSAQYELSRKIFSKAASKRMSGSSNPFFGKTFDNATKAKISKGGKKRIGKNNGMFGQTHSQEAKDAVSKANKGRLVGDLNPSKRSDVRNKISKANSGSNNGNARKWKITEPSGNTYIIHGGIRPHMKKIGITFNKKDKENGWYLERLS